MWQGQGTRSPDSRLPTPLPPPNWREVGSVSLESTGGSNPRRAGLQHPHFPEAPLGEPGLWLNALSSPY